MPHTHRLWEMNALWKAFSGEYSKKANSAARLFFFRDKEQTGEGGGCPRSIIEKKHVAIHLSDVLFLQTRGAVAQHFWALRTRKKNKNQKGKTYHNRRAGSGRAMSPTARPWAANGPGQEKAGRQPVKPENASRNKAESSCSCVRQAAARGRLWR